jgi:LTXXQ motif family protein
MKKTTFLPATLVVLAAVALTATSADARRWRHWWNYGGTDYAARGDPDDRARRDSDDRARGRNTEFPDAALRNARPSGAFSVAIDRLIRGCGQQAAELKSWPFAAIADIVRPDDTQRSALEALRTVSADAAERLAANCPQAIPAAPEVRLEAVEQAIDAANPAFAAVQPALEKFYAALDDEQKARLFRDLTTASAPPRSSERTSERSSERYERRSYRWRAYARAERAAPAPDRTGGANAWGGICEYLTAALRGWPVRDIERNVRLSEPQRVAFYELVTSSLKAADALAGACPAETALTPAGRMEVLRARLAAVRAATAAIRPALVRFYEALDQGQKVRFAGMS